MKNQPSKFENIITTVLSFPFAFVMVAIVVLWRSVVFPLLRIVGRMLLNGAKKGGLAALERVPAVKKAKAKAQMPTPDIFKGAPNLAPAKSVRFR